MAARTFEFRVTHKPGDIAKALTQACLVAATQEVAESERRLSELTSNWQDRPEFISGAIVRGNKIQMSILTDSDKFLWVDKGTQPHLIVPRSAKVLKFSAGYTPKTLKGSRRPRKGGFASGETVFAKKVKHPGIEPRGYVSAESKALVDRLQRRLDRLVRSVRV